jgi:transcriptional regulator with XRE-family HTH domain
MPTATTPLGQVIDRSGLRRNHIARRCGVEEWTVSRWIRGTSQPGEAQQLALAAVLNLDLEDLQALLPEKVGRGAPA